MKSYYELFGIGQSAEPDEIKRAFRREIARYHPDKVQHLGAEFQEIAATRAAELTEAYRILMDPATRQEYDTSLATGAVHPPRQARSDRAAGDASASPSVHKPTAGVRAPEQGSPDTYVPESLRATQVTLSMYVRKATIGRLRDAVTAVFGSAESLPMDGFDAAFALKPRRGFFQKTEAPISLLARVVPVVDGTAIQEVWPLAMKAVRPDCGVCLLVLGPGLAPSRELASTIAEQRRRIRPGQGVPVVVPVDTRDWTPLLPPETPSGVRKLLERLKLGI